MALTVDKADVLLMAAELSAVSDAQWAQIWADVALEVGEVTAGSQARADRMAIQLAAHLATVRHVRVGGAASPGPLTSVSVGGVSKSFAQPQGGSANLSLQSTKYGQEYVRLTRLFGRRFEVT
jgi:hypothetical protein